MGGGRGGPRDAMHLGKNLRRGTLGCILINNFFENLPWRSNVIPPYTPHPAPICIY